MKDTNVQETAPAKAEPKAEAAAPQAAAPSPQPVPPQPAATKTSQPIAARRFKVDRKALRKNRIYTEATDESSRIAISAYKTLRTRVLREMRARNVRSLVVTGTTAGVGKSVTATNLAINIARHKDHRVLLVDLDLRAPSVAKLFGVKPEIGIDHIETDAGVFPSAVLHPDIQNLSILPCTRGQQDSTELLLSPRMRALLDVLRNIRDNTIVIFDAPPVLGCDDVAAIVPFMDLCLMVISEAETNRRELAQALDVLGDAPIAAVLLNKSSSKFFGRYYY